MVGREVMDKERLGKMLLMGAEGLVTKNRDKNDELNVLFDLDLPSDIPSPRGL